MNEYILECTGDLNATEAALCAQRNESYPEWVSQYATLSEQSGSEADAETAEAYEEVRDQQQTYTKQQQEFERLREAYETARENGNETRARELARELTELSTSINNTSRSLESNVQDIGDNTNSSVTSVVTQVNQTTSQQVATAAEIRERELTGTSMSVTLNRTQVGFTSPARVSGTLHDENGSAVANQTIRLRVGQQVLQSQTNSSGNFEVTYRPVRIPVDTQNLTVRYLPDTGSLYLGSADSAEISIQQVSASTSLETDPDSVTYGENISVTVTATVDGQAVSGLAADIQATELTSNVSVTNESGKASTRLALLPNASVGETTIRVSENETSAVAVESAETRIEVVPAETNLSLSVIDRNESAVVVSGHLETATAMPISNRTVVILVENETAQTAETDANGSFVAVLPSSVFPETGQVALTAKFKPISETLTKSQAQSSLDLGTPESGLPIQSILIILGVGAVASGLGVGWWRYRGGSSDEVNQPIVDDDGASDHEKPGLADDSADTSNTKVAAVESLASAESRLETNPDSVAVVAYNVVREALGSHHGYEPSVTHGEFARRVASDVDEETAASVTELVSIYEQVAFSPADIDEQQASRALNLARTIVE
ncbi:MULTISPECIES: DUF4129 domain-containing protein [Haloferax]|uniref:DUF4129 domain-containing protein n=1 Tax=Haloferax marinum TaxID=2666143 RepID=A0A6A8GB95_9EURY|nr:MULTISPECIES: DUF4129 domain-containing protein [Haloferax]KAB1198226.1 DUF4129 domain-containing protein [Haloferax sp. CBA1150]MRW97316.1 DUF4129 domain-containing protein [Haloferax marinum]